MIRKLHETFLRERLSWNDLQDHTQSKSHTSSENLQASYDEDTNEITEQAAQEKDAKENLGFWLI